VILKNRRYAALQDFAPVFGYAPGDPVAGTELPDLDFVALAAGQGVPGVRIERAGALRGALAEALRAEGPRLVEIEVA
jgi:benzoylformate decarboxylase